MEYKGFTYTPTPKTAWDNLSMLEKSEMMKVAVRNGITDLNTIKEQYNEFAEGGYLDWKEKVSKYKHLDIDNDRTYDYEGWYNENPQRAWDFLNDSPDAHFDDKYKTVYHPTFSTQSKYSGKKDATYNPLGLTGGTWNKQGTVFTMSPDGYRGPVSMDDRKWYLENAEDKGVQLREVDGSLPIYDGIPWGGVLPNVTITGNRFANGGGIHIKPSHRGRLTELKKRTGKTEAELYRTGSPATRKMITFARNARKWKHGLGGNLFSGEEKGSQKMQIGLRVTNDWKPFTLGDVLANTARIEQQKQALENRIKDEYILSNDATSVASGRPQNRHLERKAVEGAKQYAAWEKEHPVLNTIGTALGASPFAVAATPLLAAAGEVAAPVLANPYVDATLTSGFGTHGLNHAINEGIDGWGDAAMTALEVAPLGRLAKPMFNEAALAIENYRYPLGRPQVPDGYLTIKPQIKSYNNSITEVPFFTWDNDNRFKVSPTKESYKEIYSQILAAKKYKESPEYADLVRKAAQESEKLGIGDFPEDLFTAPNGKSIKLIFENRPKGQLGEYVPEDNVMKLDILQSEGMEVPYHEGIHWQRVGNPDNIGLNFSKWWKARKSGQSDDVQQKLFENFRNSEEYNRYIKRRNADRYLEYKVDNALYPFADDYLRARGELQAHGLEAGRAIGLKPFLPYPGMKSALNAIDKARGYNPYLNDVKSGGEENVKRFWDILTGQYAPSLIPLGLVGTGYGLTNK